MLSFSWYFQFLKLVFCAVKTTPVLAEIQRVSKVWRLTFLLLPFFSVGLRPAAYAMTQNELHEMYLGSKKAIELLIQVANPQKSYNLFLGQSPTFINATMQELGFQNISSVPFSGLTHFDVVAKIKTDPDLKKKVFDHLSKFLPGKNKLKGKTLYLIDIAMSGWSLYRFHKLLEFYFAKTRQQVQMAVISISPETQATIPVDLIGPIGSFVRTALADQLTDSYSEYGSFYLETMSSPEKEPQPGFQFYRSVMRDFMENDPWVDEVRSSYRLVLPPKVKAEKKWIEENEEIYLLSILDPNELRLARKLFRKSQDYHFIISAIRRSEDSWRDQVELFLELVPYWRLGNRAFFHEIVAILLKSPRSSYDAVFLERILELIKKTKEECGQSALELYGIHYNNTPSSNIFGSTDHDYLISLEREKKSQIIRLIEASYLEQMYPQEARFLVERLKTSRDLQNPVKSCNSIP